ncbi:hypothetical protein CLAFUW4_13010 [Fulvia fulva]|uniref:Uncharacterized protein n=1 Tax=Passalora fulva TaxID=5499 RepID=A0A9Q8UVA7_PASFU|nr:uncharacterized protein CLAFUR5_12871 [Fulvia fulva]KAK4611908.1 hypothetical protein CLAFUR4_13014 [Fulvia fulva]UJO23710.1 hypothetical protein CLAFUR5_12871 [Fulvia fulva]WPV21533.1 hypothetical protein CLAFUW4_13010 [Fulvia fulva]WPV35939.1 hypothetical protein CLAFUW7_13017 [Fulvia fulva]
MFPLLAKIFLPKIANKVFGKAAAAAGVPIPQKQPGRPLTITIPMVFSALLFIPAVVLVVLCFFAGHKPGFLDEYAVYTVNVFRIGENILTGMNQQIRGVNITKRSEASLPVTLPVALFARDDDDEDETTSSKAQPSTTSTKPTSARTTPTAKPTATPAPSKPAAAAGPAQSAVIQQVNKAFGAVVDDFALDDFYDFHVLGRCYGSYVAKNGSASANVTDGTGATVLQDKLEKKVTACEKKASALTLAAVAYGFAMICTGLAFVASIVSSIYYRKKFVLVTLGITCLALLAQLLSSAAAHAIANSATGLVDFVGHPVGIDGSAGKKFITLTWAATIILAILAGLWGMLLFFGRNEPAFNGQKAERLESVQHEQYNLSSWPQHPHASHAPTARSASVYSRRTDGFEHTPTYPTRAYNEGRAPDGFI